MSLDSGFIGADFTKVALGGTSDFAVGTRGKDKNGVEYVYVSSTVALAQYQMYKISAAYGITTTGVTAPAATDTYAIGVPQTGSAAPVSGVTYNYAWVAVKGPLTVFAAAGLSAGAKLYTCSYAGTVHTTAQSLIGGAYLVNSVLATAASLSAQIFAAEDLRL